MKPHLSSRYPRLKEVTGVVLVLAAVGLLFALASYSPADPSWNNATGIAPPHNKIGRVGAYLADFSFQLLGLTAWALPFLCGLLGWRWLRSKDVQSPLVRIAGYSMLAVSLSGGLSLLFPANPLDTSYAVGGL
ncbi:MAG: DNA translocase FtsK 4TM domain-containing protein, partial [Acidobacteria bacterium]|nr:DNA translocase FtsK 4TM domain-containing protein [Acidobacteriota bacterium]